MDETLLASLMAELDKPIARYSFLESYYTGTQQNGFLSREQRDLLGNRLSRLSVNIPRLAVSSVSDRLAVRGFTGADVWGDWTRLNCDQWQDVVHREAMVLGEAWVIVWQRDGKPFATPESAWNMAALRDPATGEITAAIKRFDTDDATEAVVFLPDKIYKLRSRQKGASTPAGFHVYDTLDNPLNVVPVVCFQNSDRFDAHSELDDLVDLVDGLNLALADLAVAQSFYARPTQYATGVVLEEKAVVDDEGHPVLDSNGDPVTVAESPFPPENRMHVLEPENAKMGELAASDLSGFEAAVRIWLSAIQAVTSLPASALGVLSDQPVSADALRASSYQLESRAASKGAVFGRAWERVAALIYAIGHPGTEVADVNARVTWRAFGVSSEGMAADATVKLYQAGLLSLSGALARLGYSSDEIAAERAAIRAESLDKQGVTLSPPTAPNVPQNGPESLQEAS